jgi:O-antigen/teichoic acid export membrane protein
MSNHQTIIKNTVFITAAEILGLLFSFLFVALLARYLGVMLYGLYAFGAAFVAMFRVLYDPGINTYIAREIARYRERTGFYFTNSLGIEVCLALLGVLGVTACAVLLGYDPQHVHVVLLSGIIFALDMNAWLPFSVFTAYEHREYEAAVKIFGRFALVVLGLIGIFLGLALLEILMLLLVASFLKLILGYFLLFDRVVKPAWEWNLSAWRPLLVMAFPFALTNLFLDVYFNIDMTMLSLMKNFEAVGWYSVGYRFISLFIIVPSAFALSVWPVLSRLFIQSEERLRHLFQKSVEYMLVLAIPITVGMTLIADVAVLAIFGPQYRESIPAVRILMWVLPFLFLTHIGGVTLGAVDRPYQMVTCLIAALVTNVSLNLLLIPMFSFSGAAFTTVVTEIVLLVLYLYHVKKAGLPLPGKRVLLRPLAAGGMMAAVIFPLRPVLSFLPDVMEMAVLIFVAIVVYGAGLFLLGAIGSEERQILRDLRVPFFR